MNIVVLLGQYYPKMSANGACIDEIINYWREWGHSVDIICSGKRTMMDAYSGKEQVHTVKATDLMQIDEVNTPRLKKTWNLLKRKVSILMGVPFWPIRFPLQCLAYYRIALTIIKAKKVDQIYSVVLPFESMVGAYYVKKRHPEIKWTIYELDTFVNGVDKNVRRLRREGLEEKYYMRADCIAHMECHDAYYQQKRYDKVRNKFVTLDIPLISKRTNQIVNKGRSNQKKKSELVFVYSGILLENIRSPEYAIDTFIYLARQQKMLVEFYSRGRYEAYLKNKQLETNGLIVSCGYVEQQALYRAIADADVLVSIGNSQTDSIPSKIFMYMSTGKPIIHFYSQDDDVCLKYLQKYSRVVLCDSRKSIQQNATRIAVEISNVLAKPADNFDTVAGRLFLNTPEYSATVLSGASTVSNLKQTLKQACYDQCHNDDAT